MGGAADAHAPTGAPDPTAVAGTHPALPVMDDTARSRDAGVCPFLRADVDGRLVAPVHEPREYQTCVAIGAPRPQSTSQQELVCLRTAHVDCPRYQRGALVPPPAPARSTPKLPRATLAALLILVLSAGVSFGYVVQRGGLDIPAAGVSETPTEEPFAGLQTMLPTETGAPATVEPATDAPVVDASATAGGSAGEVPSVEPTQEPTADPTASPRPKPTPKPTANATPKPSATPKSDRYRLLKACPDKKRCWIYTVRSGDNLFSIAKYFGHPISTIYAWNPQYPGTRLKAGAQIRMPPPTR